MLMCSRRCTSGYLLVALSAHRSRTSKQLHSSLFSFMTLFVTTTRGHYPFHFPLTLFPSSPTPYTLHPTPFLLSGALLIVAFVVVALLWRHKKAGMGEIMLTGKIGSVRTALEPEGSVMVGGELWRARARDGSALLVGDRVRVVGGNGHLLEVERALT